MEIIQTLNLIVTFLMSLASLITIIVTVHQNKKVINQNNEIIETSNRPYLGIYFKTIYVKGQPQNFIILKNFGKTAAIINSIDCSIEIENYLFAKSYNPFKHLPGLTVYPDQSFTFSVDGRKISENNITNIIFTICYTPLYSSKIICEKHTINYTFFRNILYEACPHPTNKENPENELKTISDILHRDLIEKL